MQPDQYPRMWPVCIMSWYPEFNGSHFGLPPSFQHPRKDCMGSVAISCEPWFLRTGPIPSFLSSSEDELNNMAMWKIDLDRQSSWSRRANCFSSFDVIWLVSRLDHATSIWWGLCTHCHSSHNISTCYPALLSVNGVILQIFSVVLFSVVKGWGEIKKTPKCEKHSERSRQHPRIPTFKRNRTHPWLLATDILAHRKFVKLQYQNWVASQK